jgi:hypothetical protein
MMHILYTRFDLSLILVVVHFVLLGSACHGQKNKKAFFMVEVNFLDEYRRRFIPSGKTAFIENLVSPGEVITEDATFMRSYFPIFLILEVTEPLAKTQNFYLLFQDLLIKSTD